MNGASAKKQFYVPSDRELVNEILKGKATIHHESGDRYAQDIKEALAEIIAEYDRWENEITLIHEMERHIEKLEAMLDRRNVRYKKWEDVEYDL